MKRHITLLTLSLMLALAICSTFPAALAEQAAAQSAAGKPAPALTAVPAPIPPKTMMERTRTCLPAGTPTSKSQRRGDAYIARLRNIPITAF